jgi:methionine-gamma-lyase
VNPVADDDRDPLTRSAHAASPDGEGPITPPIHQTTTWELPDADTAAAKTQATRPEDFYTRWGNPTNARLEEALADLEGAEGGLATASGMGAISSFLMSQVEQGARVVTQTNLYSATSEFLDEVLEPRFGVDVTRIDPEDTDGFRRALEDPADLVYLETPANPTMRLADVAAVVDAAQGTGALVAVDNTFANPLNQRPLELGADVVLHSTTKSLGGHSDVTGGAVLGPDDVLEDVWYHYKMLGPTSDPFASWLVLRGLRTLALRTRQMNGNAQALAEHLHDHDAVDVVHYPGLKAHPQHDLAARQMDGYGGLISFELEGGYEAGEAFAEALDVATLAVSLGGTETLVTHPASTTHGPLTPEQRAQAGIADGLIRMSVGVEATEDLLDDVDQALP